MRVWSPALIAKLRRRFRQDGPKAFAVLNGLPVDAVLEQARALGLDGKAGRPRKGIRRAVEFQPIQRKERIR
jgi:hypothetical protein